MNKKIQVLYVEPMQEPHLKEIELTLDNLQMLVGGYFEAVYPFDDPVVLVCNEEGKYNGQLPNRAMIINGQLHDIIYGPFFIAGIGEEDFESIPDNLIRKYTEFFSD